jgi:hypothetical protein
MAGEGFQGMAARGVCKDVQETTKALQSPCRRRGSQSYSQKRLLKTAEESWHPRPTSWASEAHHQNRSAQVRW